MSDNLNTIPMPKLTAILNDFIFKTVNHLNKLSVSVEDKLQDFDIKLNDLEAMTALLEAKLDSLPPEITSTYPQLQQCSLDDVNPVINFNAVQSPPPQNVEPQQNPQQTQEQQNPEQVQNGPTEAQPEQPPEEEPPKELTPQEKIDQLIEENGSEYRGLYKMLKVGVPEVGVKQKGVMTGLDEEVIDQLIELYNQTQ